MTAAIDDPAAIPATLAALRAAFPDLDVRPGMATILVAAAEPDPMLLSRVGAWLEDADAVAHQVDVPGGEVVIRATYDGADLAAVADLLRCPVPEVVRAHTRQEWSVAMMGFAPGFGYLVPVGASQLPWERIPRLDQPRPQVPRGSVAVAAGMSAVYPTAMPGGWLLLGTSDAALFDAANPAAPTLLRPADRVRFVEVSPGAGAAG